ncbi:hypothetical protein JFJ09_17380 [Pseudoalteromonas arctica]|uniref:hypothetical protein n=1 Tax=Pseudoalteromonas arctica TaxID=394751 RepID=UPI001C9CD2FA|nr:hypothetical protein [Pseudoalteromonas arctica]MBZ2193975.1 hypothetical protein [Pseudoalteromonas arctica]
MKTLFQLWLSLTIISYTIFTPIYLFSNSSEDTIEELTFEELYVMMKLERHPSSAKDLANKLEKLADRFDFDPSLELFESLESQTNIDNIKISVTEGILKLPGEAGLLDKVNVTFDHSSKGSVKLSFLTSDKSYFLPNFSQFYGPLDVFINGKQLSAALYDKFFYELYYPS